MKDLLKEKKGCFIKATNLMGEEKIIGPFKILGEQTLEHVNLNTFVEFHSCRVKLEDISGNLTEVQTIPFNDFLKFLLA